MSPTRRGKIASLPVRVREELCRRLHDGKRAPELLTWLHTLPEVRNVLDEHFEGLAITEQNLSEWRQGGYQDYLRRLEKVEQTRLLSDYCARVAEANPHGTNLPAAIAGGQLLEVLEDFDAAKIKVLLSEKPESYIDLLLAMAKLSDARSKERVAEQNDRRLAQSETKLAQAERALQLAESRFRWQTAELFLAFYRDEAAKEIVEKGGPKQVQMALLVKRMFGERPTERSAGFQPAVPQASSLPQRQEEEP